MKNFILSNNTHLRESIYNGEIFCIPSFPASLGLVDRVNLIIKDTFSDFRELDEAVKRLSSELLFERLGKIRSIIMEDQEVQVALASVVYGVGFSMSENQYDSLRLRVITPTGHLNPRAAPAYTAHRDTWYANPQAQINWWISLHDVSSEQAFLLYPAYFRRALANSSQQFDYEEWSKNVGWQNSRGGSSQAVYPSPIEDFDRQGECSYPCSKGSIILFSGGHLHQTVPNLSSKTRWSIDFRTVHIKDHNEGRGAPNLDNLSRGSTLGDYRIFCAK